MVVSEDYDCSESELLEILTNDQKYDANIKRVDASVKVSVESTSNGNGNGIRLRDGVTGSMTKGSRAKSGIWR